MRSSVAQREVGGSGREFSSNQRPSLARPQHTVDFYMRRGAELAEEVLTELTDKDDANTVFSAGFPDIQLAKPLGGS